ncbi:hypothetical protein MRB53_008157 [Persea americana]|uniref:Uncharacterized protein n=1 Tax=Persea americana TaxID=3435 RepID=A0ACC2MM61_PERAE|nr:hypothetical protein MRB53_008157 [Persea americana]
MAPVRAWRETAADRKPKSPSLKTLNRFNLLSVLSIFLLISFATSESHQIPEFQFCDAGYVDSSCLSSQQSNSKILIKGGTVVNAHSREVADVYIEDGIIASVRPNIVVGDDVTVLDATGKYVMPGELFKLVLACTMNCFLLSLLNAECINTWPSVTVEACNS